MRVLVISPHYPPDLSGVADYVALLAQGLAGCGVGVTVVTSARQADGHGRRNCGSLLRVIGDWGWTSLPRLVALALQGRYDLVHIQYQNEMYGRAASIAALPLALHLLAPHLPVIVTIHDYGTPWPRRVRVRAIAGPYGKAWFAAMLFASTRIILTNEQDWWRFLQRRVRYPIPRSRYTLIPVGTNLPDVPAPAAGVPAVVTVGYFGFVNPAKGVETLLDAFALARRRNPSLRLALICTLDRTDAYHARLLRRLDEPDLVGAVTVTGTLDDAGAAAALAGCDVVALPFTEGAALRRTTLVAALALGCAVISTRSPHPPAALRDGRDLVLVPPQDATALAEAILELAADPARRVRLRLNARNAAAAFAWPIIAQKTVAVYREELRRP